MRHTALAHRRLTQALAANLQQQGPADRAGALRALRKARTIQPGAFLPFPLSLAIQKRIRAGMDAIGIRRMAGR